MAFGYFIVLISRFDPWNNKLCTCPLKYTFNPYTGCSHACIYCYISSYIPNAFHARVKHNVFKRLKKELGVVDSYLTLSNSSDPYTPEEKDCLITRRCLKILKDNDIPVLIVTKSDIIARDIDIISEMKASVSMTITTSNYEKARMIEPNAPSPQKRVNALKSLAENGILCSVRFDPIIPDFNDIESKTIIKQVAPYVSHIVSSTIKPREDSLKRLSKVLDISKYKWMHYGKSYYLPIEHRLKILSDIKRQCTNQLLSFSTCRENIPNNSLSCDGSHLLAV